MCRLIATPAISTPLRRRFLAENGSCIRHCALAKGHFLAHHTGRRHAARAPGDMFSAALWSLHSSPCAAVHRSVPRWGVISYRQPSHRYTQCMHMACLACLTEGVPKQAARTRRLASRGTKVRRSRNGRGCSPRRKRRTPSCGREYTDRQRGQCTTPAHCFYGCVMCPAFCVFCRGTLFLHRLSVPIDVRTIDSGVRFLLAGCMCWPWRM